MAHKYIDLSAKGSKPVPADQLSTVPQPQSVRDESGGITGEVTSRLEVG